MRTSKTRPRTLRLPEAPIVYMPSVVRVGRPIPPVMHAGRASHEGKCLSVSECPDNWVRIAKLGGMPWFEMTREGGRFLDFHSMYPGPLRRWALRDGLAEVVRAYEVRDQLGSTELRCFDLVFRDSDDPLNVDDGDGDGDVAVSLYESEDDAERHADECGADVVRRRLVVPTYAACDLAGYRDDSRLMFRDDVLAVILAERYGLDGVWWDDVDDVDGLSSPRGGILPDKVAEWKHRRIK